MMMKLKSISPGSPPEACRAQCDAFKKALHTRSPDMVKLYGHIHSWYSQADTGEGKLAHFLTQYLCDRNGSPSTITNSGLLIARLDDSKDEREWQGLATEAKMIKRPEILEGHYSVQWMGQACVEYLCALIRQALVLYRAV